MTRPPHTHISGPVGGAVLKRLMYTQAIVVLVISHYAVLSIKNLCLLIIIVFLKNVVILGGVCKSSFVKEKLKTAKFFHDGNEIGDIGLVYLTPRIPEISVTTG